MAYLSVLALDMGATSGRGVIGHFDGSRLAVKEINRFITTPYFENGHIYVDYPALFQNCVQSMQKAQAAGFQVSSIGTDSWGLDMGMLDIRGRLLSDPFHYQDLMNVAAAKEAYNVIPPKMLFMETGSQPICIKSLFMLLAVRRQLPAMFDKCRALLHISDLINYYFCGEKKADRTIIGTTQLYSVRTRSWNDKLIKQFGFTKEWFRTETDAGCVIGRLKQEYAPMSNKPYITLTCGHDTASAFLASGAVADKAEIVMSCGTRSLIGVVTSEPDLSEETFRLGFTNETGFGGSVRLLKSCMGMYLFDKMRRELFAGEINPDFDALMRMVDEAEPFRSLIDPEDLIYWEGHTLCQSIRERLALSHQALPETPGQYLRCILESCVCNWTSVIMDLKKLMKNEPKLIRVTGGGSKNAFIMQLLASMSGMPILVGSAEGASFGNALTQLSALEEIKTMDEMCQVIERSTEKTTYEPATDMEQLSAVRALYSEVLLSTKESICNAY